MTARTGRSALRALRPGPRLVVQTPIVILITDLGVRDLCQGLSPLVGQITSNALFIFCETNNRTEVRETFVLINSLGMRIGAADRAFARATEFDMRGLVRDVQLRLNLFLQDIRRTRA
jgi:hypothetical protein